MSPDHDGANEPLRGLGKSIFFDVRLGADGRTACSTCHDPEIAYQDGRTTAHGAFDSVGTRNTPSLLNVARQRELFWDGRRESLAGQALDPLLNPLEQGNEDVPGVLKKLRSFPEYVPMFEAANQSLGQPQSADVNERTLRLALAAFESQLADGDSPFERATFRAQPDAISDAARRGAEIFRGRAGCVACHEESAAPPMLFTDQGFHALGTRKGIGGQQLADLVNQFMARRQSGQSLDEILLSDAKMAQLGRFVVTENPADIGKFKTPSLRNVAITAPYMHDGSVPTLREAVDLEIYYRGSADGHPLILLEGEKADLLAFLDSLTSFKRGE